MKTIEVKKGPSFKQLLSNTLFAGSKQPAEVEALQAVRLVRNDVLLDAQHIQRYKDLCGQLDY